MTTTTATTAATIYISTITPSAHTLELTFDHDSDAESLQEQIDAFLEMVQDTNHQEIEVIDYDDEIIPRCIAKNIDPEKWIEYMEAYEEHGDAFRLYVEEHHYAGADLSDTLSHPTSAVS